MTTTRHHRRTHLYTVRLWVESAENNHSEVRGQVQYVQGGDVYFFRTWQELIRILADSLREIEKGAVIN